MCKKLAGLLIIIGFFTIMGGAGHSDLGGSVAELIRTGTIGLAFMGAGFLLYEFQEYRKRNRYRRFIESRR